MCEKSDPPRKRCTKSSAGDPSSPFPPARLFCGCFSGFPELLRDIKADLEAVWGPVSATSGLLPFPETRLYVPTMGRDLKRVFYVFEGLYPQDCLAQVKQRTCELEEEVARRRSWPVSRPLNLDPGLLSEERIVLASTKARGHRLPRADGIYEEITLLFFNGAFQPLLWTYPDWRSPACHEFFSAVRAAYLAETRAVRAHFRKAAEKRRF